MRPNRTGGKSPGRDVDPPVPRGGYLPDFRHRGLQDHPQDPGRRPDAVLTGSGHCLHEHHDHIRSLLGGQELPEELEQERAAVSATAAPARPRDAPTTPAAVSRSLASVRLSRGARPSSRVPPALPSPGRNSGPDSVTRQSTATDSRRPRDSRRNLGIPCRSFTPTVPSPEATWLCGWGPGDPKQDPHCLRPQGPDRHVNRGSRRLRGASDGRKGGQTQAIREGFLEESSPGYNGGSSRRGTDCAKV